MTVRQFWRGAVGVALIAWVGWQAIAGVRPGGGWLGLGLNLMAAFLIIVQLMTMQVVGAYFERARALGLKHTLVPKGRYDA